MNDRLPSRTPTRPAQPSDTGSIDARTWLTAARSASRLLAIGSIAIAKPVSNAAAGVETASRSTPSSQDGAVGLVEDGGQHLDDRGFHLDPVDHGYGGSLTLMRVMDAARRSVAAHTAT